MKYALAVQKYKNIQLRVLVEFAATLMNESVDSQLSEPEQACILHNFISKVQQFNYENSDNPSFVPIDVKRLYSYAHSSGEPGPSTDPGN